MLCTCVIVVDMCYKLYENPFKGSSVTDQILVCDRQTDRWEDGQTDIQGKYNRSLQVWVETKNNGWSMPTYSKCVPKNTHVISWNRPIQNMWRTDRQPNQQTNYQEFIFCDLRKFDNISVCIPHTVNNKTKKRRSVAIFVISACYFLSEKNTSTHSRCQYPPVFTLWKSIHADNHNITRSLTAPRFF